LKIVNFWAGPGSGKSTVAAGLYYELKKQSKINVELVQEMVKDKVYEGTDDLNVLPVLNVAQQYYKYVIYDGQLDYAISDSPIMLSYIYGSMTDIERDLIREWHWNFPSINFFLKRNSEKEYNVIGRIHTESESREIDDEIIQVMENELDHFWQIYHNEDAVGKILEILKNEDSNLWQSRLDRS